MTLNDIRIHEHPFGYGLTGLWLRDDRDTSSEIAVRAGEPLKVGATAGQFCVRMVDADTTIGTDQPTVGVAAAPSTETASVDGNVEYFLPLPGVIYEIKALTASLADTEAKINLLRGEYHILDLSATTASGVYSLDTAAGTGASNAFLITGGDPVRSVLYIMFRSDSTVFGRAQV